MKILAQFAAFAALSCSGANADFPVTNIVDLEPGLRLVFSGTGDNWILVDFGAAKSLDVVFLNQANFPACTLQGNASDSWTTPSFTQSLSLVRDDAKNRKGWFDLTGFNYRYARIFIPSGQSLDNSETYAALGNLVFGTAEKLPFVNSFNPKMNQGFRKFVSDGGNLRKEKKGIARFSLSVGIGDSLAKIRSMSKSWDIAVFYAEMGDAGESWLVLPPEEWPRPIENISRSQISFVLEEKS